MNIDQQTIEQCILFEPEQVAVDNLRNHILSQGYNNVTVSIDFDAIDRRHHVFILAEDDLDIVQRHFSVGRTTTAV